MNRYLISGAEKTTGKDMKLEIQALSDQDARSAAANEGILITECKLMDGKTAATVSQSDAYLRESVMWLRFLGISTALCMFAVIVKLIMAH